MALRIALCVGGRIPVEKYGGTERVVVWLARELIRQGHAVTVIAGPGSYVPGARMILVPRGAPLQGLVPPDVDIVHLHGGGLGHPINVPILITVHGRPSAVPATGNYNFVSASHAAHYGRKSFVHNGLPPDEHYFSDTKSRRLLFLSRINRPGKNVTAAIRLAKKFDYEMDLAGGARWELLTRSLVRREGAFFASLDRRFRFHGMQGGWRKAELFAHARALLFPIRWEEPFGLVAVESLLAGTPVITTARGSMPELIHPDIGFLCESDEEFGAAFEAAGSIPPQRCRDYAADRFSVEKTSRQYLELYQRILDGETLP